MKIEFEQLYWEFLGFLYNYILLIFVEYRDISTPILAIIFSILTLVFLFAAASNLKIRSIRLYGTTIISGFSYISLSFFPEFEFAANDIIGADTQVTLDVIRILMALVVYFSSIGYFASAIADISYGEDRRASSTEGFIESLFELVFSAIPSLFSGIILSIRFGVLPLLLVAIVLHDSWELTTPYLLGLHKLAIIKIEQILNLPWIIQSIEIMISLF